MISDTTRAATASTPGGRYALALSGELTRYSAMHRTRAAQARLDQIAAGTRPEPTPEPVQSADPWQRLRDQVAERISGVLRR